MPDIQPLPSLNAPSSEGQPLPQSVRQRMETAFGADFSKVRVHEGHEATHLNARAFTTGTDIFFAPGEYDPCSSKGQELLGHELTHVVQQNKGRGSQTPPGMVVSNPDKSLESEADAIYNKALSFFKND